MKWIKRVFGCLFGLFLLVSLTMAAVGQQRSPHAKTSWWWSPRIMLVGVGNSMTHGTRDATNNEFNTKNAYLQLVYKKLKETGLRFKFVQPYLNENEHRINPLAVPTNLAVDGEDIFSVEGYEYGPRVGAGEGNYLDDKYLCDRLQPYLFADLHDKVLYPINLLARKPVSQFDALIWRLNNHRGPAWVIWWVGTNDAALASLGLGGENPMYLPIPFAQIKDKLKLGVRLLLEYGYNRGMLSFSPYTGDAIKRNLTKLGDFVAQYDHLLDRMEEEISNDQVELFLLTFPYYTEPGYFFGEEDLEYYFEGGFSLNGGRISLLTFISLYALVKSGIYPDSINEGLVMSGGKRLQIRNRINDFNGYLKSLSLPSNVHLLDIGSKLNSLFDSGLWVGAAHLTREWSRGGAFSLDGVHPSHTVHAHIANLILEELNNSVLKEEGKTAPYWNLSSILANDPYYDNDGDGWVEGPDYKASGRTKILYLFKDADGDTDTSTEAVIDTMGAAEVWELISDALLEEVITIPLLRLKAEEMGLIPVKE